MEDPGRQTDVQQVFVVDIPVEATAEDMMDLLNAQYVEQGVYLNSVLQWPGTGARAVFRRLVKTTVKRDVERPAAAPDAKADKPVRNKEAIAMDFLREHRDTMTVKELRAGMMALGFTRSCAWVSSRRTAVVRAERRVS